MTRNRLRLLILILPALLLLPEAAVTTTFDEQEGEPGVAVVKRPVKIAQLVGDYDRERNRPTANLTARRFGLAGTDLGVPFLHRGRTYLLFGDTAGLRGEDAIAYTCDTNPEDGLDLTFIHDESGVYKPVFIPGISQEDFEVPMEGTSVGGKMYVYHTTDHSQDVVMGRSVVAVSEDDGSTFRYLYDLSTRYFINVSVVETDLKETKGFPTCSGRGLVIFGSGRWRKSNVRLAFQPAEQIESRSSIRYFAGFDNASQPMWSPAEKDAIALFDEPCVGELSVTYNPFLGKWIMLYNCSGKGLPIHMRTAALPWGPWSEPRVLYQPDRDKGRCHYVHESWKSKKCDHVHDPGAEDISGVTYGPYQFGHLAKGKPGSTTIYFSMSTWNPYTVLLMKAALELAR